MEGSSFVWMSVRTYFTHGHGSKSHRYQLFFRFSYRKVYLKMNEVISVTVQSDIYIDQEVENLRGLKKRT